MIFQLGIDLNIPDKDVQAIIDLDTGMIGFTEKSGDNTVEFPYQQSPPEFKKAFLDLLTEYLCSISRSGTSPIKRDSGTGLIGHPMNIRNAK